MGVLRSVATALRPRSLKGTIVIMSLLLTMVTFSIVRRPISPTIKKDTILSKLPVRLSNEGPPSVGKKDETAKKDVQNDVRKEIPGHSLNERVPPVAKKDETAKKDVPNDVRKELPGHLLNEGAQSEGTKNEDDKKDVPKDVEKSPPVDKKDEEVKKDAEGPPLDDKKDDEVQKDVPIEKPLQDLKVNDANIVPIPDDQVVITDEESIQEVKPDSVDKTKPEGNNPSNEKKTEIKEDQEDKPVVRIRTTTKNYNLTEKSKDKMNQILQAPETIVEVSKNQTKEIKVEENKPQNETKGAGIENKMELPPVNSSLLIKAPIVNKTLLKSKVVNPHDFKYVLNNESLCRNTGKVHHLIYFHSSPHTSLTRLYLRSTWPQTGLFPGLESRLVFFMGTPKDKSLLVNLTLESQKYGDIVLEDYLDSYNNMTHKAISAMKWISQFCNNTKFVIKADQDVYVNRFRMVQLLTNQYSNKSRFFLCGVYKSGDMPILRNPKNCAKWCVPKHIFPNQTSYPSYCAGAVYAFSADIAHDLYMTSLTVPYFYIDDVFVTGILPRKLGNIKHHDIGGGALRIGGSTIHLTMHEPNATNKVVGIHDPSRQNSEYYWRDQLERISEEQRTLLGPEKYKALIQQNNITLIKHQ